VQNKIYILALCLAAFFLACEPGTSTTTAPEAQPAESANGQTFDVSSDDPALDVWQSDCWNASRAVPSLWWLGSSTYRESSAFPGGSNTSLIFRLEYAPEVTDAQQKARAAFFGKYLPLSHPERVRDPLFPTDDSRRTWSLVRDVAAPVSE
jgi:hypothetical protein